MEIEKLQASSVDWENTLESGHTIYGSAEHVDQLSDPSITRCPSNGSYGPHYASSKSISFQGKEMARNGSIAQSNLEFAADDVC